MAILSMTAPVRQNARLRGEFRAGGRWLAVIRRRRGYAGAPRRGLLATLANPITGPRAWELPGAIEAAPLFDFYGSNQLFCGIGHMSPGSKEEYTAQPAKPANACFTV